MPLSRLSRSLGKRSIRPVLRPVVRAIVRERGGFTPAILFGSSEPGAWFDPSDFSTMYQDAAGTVPVTAVEQPVGLWLDKSKGLVEKVTNGQFTANVDGWTASTGNVAAAWDAGRLKVTNNGAGYVYQAVAVTANVPHILRANFVTKAGTGRLFVGNSIGASEYGGLTVAGAQTITFTPTQATIYVSTGDAGGGAGVVNIYDDISILPGNHATQSTAASRPVLKQDANGKYYLNFDGIDDSLATGSINFTSTDKVSVFAGVHKASDAATGMLCELSAAATNPGMFYLTAPEDTSRRFGALSRGSATAAAGHLATTTSASYVSPISVVQTVLMDISGDSTKLRLNGTQVANATLDQGTGTYGNYPLYIGRRAGSSLPFNGRIYALLVRGAASNDAQIASTERYVAEKTGVTL